MPTTKELTELLDLLKKKEKLAAMLAPSFPIDYSYPETIGRLKRTGFDYVVEVARGAVDTNEQVIEELSKDPQKRIITSPCPSCVGYIKAQRPELAPYLSASDSPMTATAKLVLEKFPQYKPVFIGPCLTKKIEAQYRKELNILAITFKELTELFAILKIEENDEDLRAQFDIFGPKTRLYPISGGLCQSAGIAEYLAEDEYMMVSGINNLGPALDEFAKNKNIRLLDILFCDGGCINGPGIISKEPLAKRRHKVIKFWSSHLA